MSEPTADDIEALVGPATPHFAFQIRARVRETIAGLPEGHPVRVLGERNGAAGRSRARVLEGRRRRAGATATPHRLGRGPVLRPGLEPAAPQHVTAFQGKSVFVTGGSRGIGKAIALRFARDGAARVAIGYLRSDAAAEATAEELRALGPLDVLVHNAATGVIRPALETEDKHWDWTVNANARAFLSLARVATPSMPAGSSIVAISSLGSVRVLENYVLVGTSKAALESLVRYLAVELGPRGIRVNAVSGGVVETGALDHFPNRAEMLEMGARNAAGRIVAPEDIAGAVAFLCSEDAEMVRGQTLIVDGGFSLTA
jgi:enoyl-[acyl-carrier protein] reductase III